MGEMNNKTIDYRRFLLFLLTLFPLVQVSAQEGRLITLQEAIKRTMDNNLQIKQAQFQAALTEQDVLQAKMNLLPSISGNLSTSKNWGLTFDQTAGVLVNTSVTSAGGNLNGNLVLFDGFQRINLIKQNKYQLMSDMTNVERVRNDLALSVVTTYLQALSNQDLLLAATQQVELSNEQLKAQQYNYDVGNSTLADLSQAKSQLATDELSLTTAQNGYEMSILDLKQLMEMDPNTPIELEKPLLPNVDKITANPIADDVYQRSVEDYPDIVVAKYNSMVAKKNIDVIRGDFFPVLSIGGGYGTNYSSQRQRIISSNPVLYSSSVSIAAQAAPWFPTVSPFTYGPVPFFEQLRENRNHNVFASLSIPIFDNYRRTINYRKAKISYNNALNSERLARVNFNKIINQAVLDLKAAQKRYYSTQQNFQSTSDAFAVIKDRYEVGLSNSVEMATQQTAMNRAEFDFIQAKYDFIFRSKVIDFYLGNPITFD